MRNMLTNNIIIKEAFELFESNSPFITMNLKQILYARKKWKQLSFTKRLLLKITFKKKSFLLSKRKEYEAMQPKHTVEIKLPKPYRKP